MTVRTSPLTSGILTLRSLACYWRTNLAVVLGVATAVAVLTGALLVGDSVRGTLREMVLRRLGATDYAVLSEGFFREQLANDLRGYREYEGDTATLAWTFQSYFEEVSPILALRGFVSVQAGEGRAGPVSVYGLDDRFWKFHGIDGVQGPQGREALVSPALARELDAAPGTTLLVRVQRPAATPLESIHGRKDDLGHTVRATVKAALPREAMGEFSLQAQQGEVRAIFLPLSLLQRELELAGRANTLLVSARWGVPGEDGRSKLNRMLQFMATFEDRGLRLRFVPERNLIVLEADSGLLTEAQANAAAVAARMNKMQVQPVFTYLASTLRSGDREIPYSLVTGMDIPALANEKEASEPPPIVLNDWAARDLRVSPGDHVSMDYLVWEEPGRLATRTTEFRIAGVVPITPQDRDLAPVYPGITESETLTDWDPPFPIDLRRIRSIDEEYWERYRTTPKAFIPYAVAQQLWQSRYGSMTSIRFTPPPETWWPEHPQQDSYFRSFIAGEIRSRLNVMGPQALSVRDARSESLEASSGATDFGAYFVYFSFFLVLSALMLAAMFFRLSIEQRAREVGLLRAAGFSPAMTRWHFLKEGFVLSSAGALAGALGGIAYAGLMMAGLRRWWAGAVGTTELSLHLSPVSIAVGGLGGIVASLLCTWLTLRRLASVSERRLLAGELEPDFSAGGSAPHPGRRGLIAGLALAAIGAALLTAAATGWLDPAVAFFSAGMVLLASSLFLIIDRFSRPQSTALGGQEWRPITRLGWRSAMYRPARAATAMAMIASATFILIAVDTFRKEQTADSSDRSSGTGGYSLMVESMLPLVQDPGSPAGREALGLAGMDFVGVEPLRLRPGDDASCLNLYQPANPRIAAPRAGFLEQARFSFRSSLAANDAERANPWLLLRRVEGEDVVPVIADANSMTYVLHRKLGEEILLQVGSRTIRLRLVAALRDSVFQSELLMSEDNFLRLFPEQQGYRLMLLETPAAQQDAVSRAVEAALADYGADVRSTAQRLAEFHRVENTYLSTFQLLGGLGLLLGTLGLGAVLLRNIVERRRELALMRAMGFRQTHFLAMAVAENGRILVTGLSIGAVCALIALSPALWEQDGRLPVRATAFLLGGVLVAGLLTSALATLAALRSPLLGALRTE